MKALSNVQFYGIMASVCWAFAVTVYVRHNEMPQAQHYAMTRYFVCAEQQADRGAEHDECLQKVDDDWSEWMNRQWIPIVKTALIPIGVGWLVGVVGMRVFRRKDSAPRD